MRLLLRVDDLVERLLVDPPGLERLGLQCEVPFEGTVRNQRVTGEGDNTRSFADFPVTANPKATIQFKDRHEA